MVTKTVGAASGDFATWDAACVWFNGLGTLTDDYTFDGYSDADGIIAIGEVDCAGFTVRFKTRDASLMSSAKVRPSGYGAVDIACTNGVLEITNLVLMTHGSGYVINDNGGNQIKIENCKLVFDGEFASLIVGGSPASVLINDCIIFITGDDTGYYVANLSMGGVIHNSIICGFVNTPNGQFRVHFTSGLNKNNTIWNYGNSGASYVLDGGATQSDSIIGNPNFVTAAMITAQDESINTIEARNARLTESSVSCRDNADVETSAAFDMVGTPRS